MAYTNEEKATLLAGFQGLPQSVKDLFNAKSTSDTKEAVAELIAQGRSASMTTEVAQLVSGSISNWNALNQLAGVADSAALYDILTACESAFTANSNSLLPLAVAFFIVARRHFRVAP
jgi:hypothetical protein